MGTVSKANIDVQMKIFYYSDLIKDVAVSLVPLPLNKSDNIDPAALSGIEKNIKKVCHCFYAFLVKLFTNNTDHKGNNSSFL